MIFIETIKTYAVALFTSVLEIRVFDIHTLKPDYFSMYPHYSAGRRRHLNCGELGPYVKKTPGDLRQGHRGSLAFSNQKPSRSIRPKKTQIC